jgi:ribosomal protein L11 methylase PrmA
MMKSSQMLIPYVPTPDEKVEIIMKFSQANPGMKSVDLGSGDGRIVIAMAKAGATAHGYEIIEKYVRRAKYNISLEGVRDRAIIHHVDFWKEDLSSFDIVTIYGMITIIGELEKKLSKELRPGTRVISNGFAIPGWNILKEENHVYCYIR